VEEVHVSVPLQEKEVWMLLREENVF